MEFNKQAYRSIGLALRPEQRTSYRSHDNLGAFYVGPNMDGDRFKRYEEDFLNSTRIISRGMKQLESSSGNVGEERLTKTRHR